MNERELKRQLDLLFERVRDLQQSQSDLADRVHELECSEDFKTSYFEGVIEAGDNWQVYVTDPDGERRLLRPRFDIVNHSPDGFSWGYVVSGPSQLAIAMLAHHFWTDDEPPNNQRAVALAGRFMNERIAVLKQGQGWACTSVDIDDWLTAIGEL